MDRIHPLKLQLSCNKKPAIFGGFFVCAIPIRYSKFVSRGEITNKAMAQVKELSKQQLEHQCDAAHGNSGHQRLVAPAQVTVFLGA